jgi:hypothetical protein
LTLSLVASTSLMAGMGGWSIAWCMLVACIAVGLLRNGKEVDQPGIIIPIFALVAGFLLSLTGASPVWRALEIILLAAAGGYLSAEFETENTSEFSDRLQTFLKYLAIATFSVWLALGAWFDTRPPGLDFLQQYVAKGEERHVVLIAGVYPLVALAVIRVVIWAFIFLFGSTFLAWDWLKNGPSVKKQGGKRGQGVPFER